MPSLGTKGTFLTVPFTVQRGSIERLRPNTLAHDSHVTTSCSNNSTTTRKMAEIPYQQDLAPKGGYPEIKWARNLPKRGPSGLVIMLGGIATMAVGFYFVAKTNRERRCGRSSLVPRLLFAEQENSLVNCLYRNIL